jgi:hypothetical protein
MAAHRAAWRVPCSPLSTSSTCHQLPPESTSPRQGAPTIHRLGSPSAELPYHLPDHPPIAGWPGGISPPGSHRTERESLPSLRSSHLKAVPEVGHPGPVSHRPPAQCRRSHVGRDRLDARPGHQHRPSPRTDRAARRACPGPGPRQALGLVPSDRRSPRHSPVPPPPAGRHHATPARNRSQQFARASRRQYNDRRHGLDDA